MNLHVEVAGDIGVYTPLSVVNIDDEFAILGVDLPGQEPKYFRVRLEDFSI